MKYFYQYAEFISSGISHPGTLADCSIETNAYELGFLAFLILIGTVYFKKYASAFTAPTPQSHFNSFSDPHIPVKAQHIKWLEDIRNNIWDRTQFEKNMVPSTDALYRHWTRACWVIDMWAQAASNEIVLKPLLSYGWKMMDGKLTFDWDSELNIEKVRNRVQGLLKGCKCTKGCRTNSCGCRRQGHTCTEGCQCNNCINLPVINNSDTTEGERVRGSDSMNGARGSESGEWGTEEEETGWPGEESVSEGEYDSDMNTCMPTANTEREREDNSELEAQVDEIMQTVFGDDDPYIYGDSEDD